MAEASKIKLQNTIDRIAGAILAGINLNPPPTRNIKWPCIICNRPVNSNQKAIECDTCHKWCHINCDGRLTIKGGGGGPGSKFHFSCLILCYSPGYLLSKMGSFVSSLATAPEI